MFCLHIITPAPAPTKKYRLRPAATGSATLGIVKKKRMFVLYNRLFLKIVSILFQFFFNKFKQKKRQLHRFICSVSDPDPDKKNLDPDQPKSLDPDSKH